MAILTLLLAAAPPQQELPEYVVKAGFLYNFAKYVRWPAEAFESPSSPVVVGVVGADPFGGDLARALKDKRLGERGFRVERYATAAEIGLCHILFVPRTEMPRAADVLRAVRGKPVLTVGEESAFPRAGGGVAVVIRDARPALEINHEATEQAGLVLDARLLRLAVRVKGP